jgi:hypothetical protein
MGLKGYRLWVVDQLDSTCSAPPRQLPEDDQGGGGEGEAHPRGVALQVAFERQILKPVFSLDRL